MLDNMKHLFLFEEYIRNNKISGKVYHVSYGPINKLNNRPMWFALEKSHSDDGWFKNSVEDGRDDVYQYSASVSGRIGEINDAEVVEIFNSIDEDRWDWVADITSNPDAEWVMSMKGTRALIKAGYAGLVYPDYDPRDFNYELDALLVFNGAKSVKNWKLVKQSIRESLYEAVNSIMGDELTEAEIQDLLNEGLFSWLKGLFSNPKKKRELDKLAKKLVEVRVDLAKTAIEAEDIEYMESSLDAKTDPYLNPDAKASNVKDKRGKSTLEIKKTQLGELESDIIAQMDKLGEESEKLGKYVNKVKLDSRMESTEQVMRLADTQMKKVLTKMHKKDKQASKALNKELQKS